MDEVKRIVILSHCIINVHSKVKSWKKDENIREYDLIDFLKILGENNIGIVQLPCPEMTCYGLKRWGHVKNQFDHPHYRKLCRSLFEPILDQILEYRANGIEVLALLGIYGSPTCGVNRTCIGEWGGEIGSNPNLLGTIGTVSGVTDSGIFMEEIKSILKVHNIDIPIIDYNKNYLEMTLNEIKELL